jgi:hypothetical protein
MRSLFFNALVAGLLLFCSVAGWAEDHKVGHPYAPEKSLTNVGGRHPMSAYEATRRLEAKGYKISSPLKLTGNAWEAKSTEGKVRVDQLSGTISK